MKTIRSSQNGQILVIFVLALTVLLGFTALALDGGMIYSDRRLQQSAADSAAMAGAGAAAQYMEDAAHPVTWKTFLCSNTAVTSGATTAALNAATARGSANGVTLTSGITNNQGIDFDTSHCQQPAGARVVDRHLEITVMVTSTVSTSFLHLFYNGPVKNTVTAKVLVRPRTELAYGNAIVSLSDQCGTNQGGVVFSGTTNVVVSHGGVYSNSCLDANGNVSVTADVNAGINYFSTQTGGGTLNPLPSQVTEKLKVSFPSPESDCSLLPTYSASTGSATLSPGNYPKITLGNTEHLVMRPGLYCLSGEFKVTGGFVNDPADMAAAGVTDNALTIFLKGTNNDFAVTGGNVYLTAPDDYTKTAYSMVSLLIYMADNNGGVVTLQGNGGSSYSGIVYAPKQSINVGGTSAINPTYNTQLIGNYVKVDGTSDININYQISPNNTKAPTLDMIQ